MQHKNTDFIASSKFDLSPDLVRDNASDSVSALFFKTAPLNEGHFCLPRNKNNCTYELYS